MHYKEMLSRLTGFSVPIFGVTWNPPEPEIAVARRVVTFFEDRRVFYNPYHMEMEYHCIESILETRKFLTEAIGNLGEKSDLASHLHAIRAACRQFLDVALTIFMGHSRQSSSRLSANYVHRQAFI